MCLTRDLIQFLSVSLRWVKLFATKLAQGNFYFASENLNRWKCSISCRQKRHLWRMKSGRMNEWLITTALAYKRRNYDGSNMRIWSFTLKTHGIYNMNIPLGGMS